MKIHCSALFFLFFLLSTLHVEAQYLQIGNKLVGTGAVGLAQQGTSISLSADGNTAIVGGNSDSGSAGAAWVFTGSSGTWIQQGSKLVGSGTTVAAAQGISVSLSADGNTAIVGGPLDNFSTGAAWIFTRSGGVWTQQAKLVGTGAAGAAVQGSSVAISADGNTAIVGGPNDSIFTGAAWIFTRSGGFWTQQGSKLVGTGAVGNALQGVSVAISADGNTAITGGYYDNSNVGATWVFTRSSNTWTQQGNKLVGTGATGSAWQGKSVSISSDGNTALVGGFSDNTDIGAAWVFTRSGNVWTQQGGKLVGADAVDYSQMGNSVSLSGDGNTAILGGIGDNNNVGAAWVFTRTGGVWTQYGSKLVGADVSGSAHQGSSVSLSGDGKRAIVGGNSDQSSAGGAAWIWDDGQPQIATVTDVYPDQGGYVFVNWNKSPDDVARAGNVTDYWVWRGIRAAAVPQNAVVLGRDEYTQWVKKAAKEAGRAPMSTTQTYMMTEKAVSPATTESNIYWQFIASTGPAHGLDYYSYGCPTMADSTAQGVPWRYFFVTAVTNDSLVYWDSPVDSGYSVDNLPPNAIIGLSAQSQPGPSVDVHWHPDVVDPDVGYYEIYRSTTDGFVPGPAAKIGQTSDTAFVDSSPTSGLNNYYRIITVDIHGNLSIPSSEASAPIVVQSLLSVEDQWNMISVPFEVTNYLKSALFPAAVSNAFAYQGTYVAESLLAGDVGYWLRFSGAQSIPITGLMRLDDTVDVTAGWNMIGSISQPIAVTQIAGSSPGIITSPFFTYSRGYIRSDSIIPGRGYWVKVNQDGKLILSTAGPRQADGTKAYKIRIVSSNELPPPPPDAQSSFGGVRRPDHFALEQNYPNPYNPTTQILYSLPEDAHVTMAVYNMIGEKVRVLADEVQSAGYKVIEFDARSLASGVYLYRMEAVSMANPGRTFTSLKKMVFMK